MLAPKIFLQQRYRISFFNTMHKRKLSNIKFSNTQYGFIKVKLLIYRQINKHEYSPSFLNQERFFTRITRIKKTFENKTNTHIICK